MFVDLLDNRLLMTSNTAMNYNFHLFSPEVSTRCFQECTLVSTVTYFGIRTNLAPVLKDYPRF